MESGGVLSLAVVLEQAQNNGAVSAMGDRIVWLSLLYELLSRSLDLSKPSDLYRLSCIFADLSVHMNQAECNT